MKISNKTFLLTILILLHAVCSWCVLAGLVRNSVGKKVSASVNKRIKVSFVENYCRKAVFRLTGSLFAPAGSCNASSDDNAS